MSIELLRHGDTGQRSYRGQLDDPLSVLGWQQLRSAVAGRDWDCIVSSSMRRCAEFAQELAQQRNVSLRLEPGLMEYHFGDWQGVPIETLAEQDPQGLEAFWADPVGHPPPGAETFEAFHRRTSTAIDRIAAEHAGQRVLVVTHGGVIRVLRCQAEGRSFGEMANTEVHHASLHRLDWRQAAG
ncbi:histidine phosphatase family protein [Frateuria aurantia]